MAKNIESAQVSLPGDSTVEVTRSFAAPRELVYRAHTEPELVQRWMLGPPGWSMPVCEMDLRPGGAYRWRWRSDEDGKEFGFHGTFREVVPPSRIVHTEIFDPGDLDETMGDGDEGALITLELSEKDGVTTIVSRMDFGTREARDAAMATGMTDGMEMGYQRLETLLVDVAAA
jgi:uncharacterized protein YndB with AHSA1/START domain